MEKAKLSAKYRAKLIKRATPAEKKFLVLLTKLKVPHVFQKEWIEGEAFFISDFYFDAAQLTIELDGGYHNHPDQKRKDKAKEKWLKGAGIGTIRIKNEKVDWMSIESLGKLLIKKGVMQAKKKEVKIFKK